MPNQTKEDLLKLIEEKDAVISDLRGQLLEQSTVNRGSSQPGWLIRTKNNGYTGRLFGILFEGGRAFLPASYPDAKRVLAQFVNDFGYEAEEITEDAYKPGEKAPVNREATLINNISTPHVMA